MTEIKPLIPESSTSESTTVEVALNDYKDKILIIPDYQRDADQWDDTIKSLFVESIINNLTVPAFFFEVVVEDGIEKNYVIDGQQRLTTLKAFYWNEFNLVKSDDAPYLTPNSVHYAGKKYFELPESYQRAFKKYRLSVVKLRNLGGVRLEIFRRINQGGTPLSPQDIRLAYYGENSPSLAFIRLVGIYDLGRDGAQRFIKAAEKYNLCFPWKNEILKYWKDWWEEKEIAKGQAPSEMFLWSIVSANIHQVSSLIEDKNALSNLKYHFGDAISEVLDICCAQFQYQDEHNFVHLMSLDELKERFFPYFENFIDELLSRQSPNIQIPKHRIIASVIGACYALDIQLDNLNSQQWTDIVEFIRRPKEIAQIFEISFPQSKGRWEGKAGHKTQFLAIHSVIKKIIL